MSGHSHDMAYTWQLPWLDVEQPWLALARPFLTIVAQMRNRSPCIWACTISVSVGSFQSGGAFACRRALTIESSLMSGCG